MPKNDKNYWKSKEYIEKCRKRLEVIEPVVTGFYWYSYGGPLQRNHYK